MIATAIMAQRLPQSAWITCRQTSGPTPPHHRGPGSQEVRTSLSRGAKMPSLIIRRLRS